MEGKINATDFYQLQSDHFHVLERNTLVPNDLDTGDILLFSRRCSDMNLFGACLCYGAKQYSPWDHICVIVKDPETGKLYALEAAVSGCQLYELDDRINHSKAPAIAIRYLRITRTDEQRKEIWKLVKEMDGKPYTSDTNTFIKAGFWSSQKFKRVILQNQEYLLKQQIEELHATQQNIAVDPLTSIFMEMENQSLEKELIDLQELIQKERKSRLEGEDSTNEFFCSQSVAHVLKAMNVLPQTVPTTEYLPYSFSSEVELPLLRGATFSKELFVRGTKNDVFGGSSGKATTNQLIELIQEAIMNGKMKDCEKAEDCLPAFVKESEGEEDKESVNGKVVECGSSQSVEDESSQSTEANTSQSVEANTNQSVEGGSSQSVEANTNQSVEGGSSQSTEANTNQPPTPPVPHEDVLSLLSKKDLNYILTQLHLTRTFGRSSPDSLKQLLQSMKILYYLPGDTLQLDDADKVLSILLRGEVYFNKWSEDIGEVLAEQRGPASLLGLAAHPMDTNQLVRITANDIAALGCSSGSQVDEIMKEAAGIHKLERIRLIKAMRQHPAFQHCSLRDCYQLSYYFYKVQLDEGDEMIREGCYQSYIYYVSKGELERVEKEKQGWSESTVHIEEGCFPGLDSIINNQPASATYTVKQPTTIYVLNPSVLSYFIGGRYLKLPELIEQLRNPIDIPVLSAMKEAVDGIRFYKTGESVTSMKNGFNALKGSHMLYLTEETEKLIHCFSELLHCVYCEEAEEKHQHKEGLNYALAAGVDLIQETELPSMINSLYSTVVEWLYPSEKTEDQPVEEKKLLNEEEVNKSLANIQAMNDMNDFTNEQILAVIHSFQFNTPIEIASYLLFILLSGISEPCTITKEIFIQQATTAHILTPANQQELLHFFFDKKETISFTDFINKLKATTPPASIQEKLTQLQWYINQLVPSLTEKQQQQQEIIQTYRKQNKITLSLHNPFALLPYPLPVPYMMTYALKQENPSVNYNKYIIGGLCGELFGRFVLYPAYLSSFTHLLSKDITPLTLTKFILGDKFKFTPPPSSQTSSPPSPPTKPTVKPVEPVKPVESAKPVESVKATKPSKPIVISDIHSKEVIRGKSAEPPIEIKPIKPQVKGVNPIIGGFLRYSCGFLYERLIQLTCFPIILRSVKDAEITANLSLPVQTTIAGALVGSCITLLKHPLDRKYMQRVLNLPSNSSLSFMKRLYGGFLPAFIHSSLFNAIFFGTFSFFWELNNRDYIHDHGFAHNLPHQRTSILSDSQPVHYDILGKSLICISCGYMAAQFVTYPLTVYRNMKMLHTFNGYSPSPLFNQVNSFKQFFSKANRSVLYGGMCTRICWSILSCSMGIAFGSALLTKNYRDNH